MGGVGGTIGWLGGCLGVAGGVGGAATRATGGPSHRVMNIPYIYIYKYTDSKYSIISI
jgi:hypothetical protein